MYDFIDIGSSKGGSVEFCQAKFGENGYGIDVDARKVKQAFENGFDVRHMRIEEVRDKAKWATALHVVEHLSGRREASAMIEDMKRIGRKLYITFPYFDMDGFLYRHGLKPYWSHWRGHSYQPSTLEFHNIIKDLGLTYSLEYYGEIKDSSSEYIIPLDAPKDSLGYDKSMGEKAKIDLPHMYKETRWTIR